MSFTSNQDLALVYASKSGDISAFEELVRRYDRKLFRIAQNVIHNIEDAEEVLQTAFFKAFQNVNRFQGNAKFSTWLVRIVLNESFMKLRKQHTVLEQSMGSDPEAESDGSILASRSRRPFDVTDWAQNPEALYSTSEFREILVKSLRQLRPTLRAVFTLRDIEGYSIIETAGILNLTVTAVKARLSLARMQLREELSQYFKARNEPVFWSLSTATGTPLWARKQSKEQGNGRGAFM